MSDFEVDEMIASIDTNKTGLLDIEEFYAPAILPEHLTVKKRMRKVFNAIDVNRSGGVSKEEIQACLLGNIHIYEENWRSSFNIEIGESLEIEFSREEFMKFVLRFIDLNYVEYN